MSFASVDGSAAPGVLQRLPRGLQAIALELSSRKSIEFVALCLLWYGSSAATNTTSKSIFNTVECPYTLTLAQFGFVALGSVIMIFIGQHFRLHWSFGHSGFRRPTRQVITTTLPLSMFQIWGHAFNSLATTKITVSTVHTIKALSPMFTVLAYRLLFRVVYSRFTYLSLVPLTVGVMLACDFSANGKPSGIVFAVCSTLVFVSQNIFSKKIFTESSIETSPNRIDKLNLLLYSSSAAFFFMCPVWIYHEGTSAVREGLQYMSTEDSHALALQFVANGVFHFAQNILAFSLLGMVSPVTYSVASLIKRVFVIAASIIWFGQEITYVQAFGIFLTALGLYMYDRAKLDVARGERRVRQAEGLPERDSSILPSVRMEHVAGSPASHTSFDSYPQQNDFMPFQRDFSQPGTPGIVTSGFPMMNNMYRSSTPMLPGIETPATAAGTPYRGLTPSHNLSKSPPKHRVGFERQPSDLMLVDAFSNGGSRPDGSSFHNGLVMARSTSKEGGLLAAGDHEQPDIVRRSLHVPGTSGSHRISAEHSGGEGSDEGRNSTQATSVAAES